MTPTTGPGGAATRPPSAISINSGAAMITGPSCGMVIRVIHTLVQPSYRRLFNLDSSCVFARSPPAISMDSGAAMVPGHSCGAVKCN